MDEAKRIDGKKFAENYHNILCPEKPDFIFEYASLPIMLRLDGVGLLCGTDWTPLFKNRFFYSRLDHSIGCALIIWNFTHNKKQTLAGLFHDIATPAFSHVIDFKNGDVKNQSSTEEPTRDMINEDLTLSQLLFNDGIYKYEIDDYSKYPIAENPRPGLNADRLEYMYPSGAALCDEWSLDEIKENYSFIKVLKNENGLDELGFSDLEAACNYTKKFLNISKVLQKHEDKISMQLLADTITKAMECKFLSDFDLFQLDEKSIVRCFDRIILENQNANENSLADFCRLWKTFRGMKKVVRSENPIENSYNLNLDVKKRYVDPLVETNNGPMRISKIKTDAKNMIDDFLNFKDSTFGSVPWL